MQIDRLSINNINNIQEFLCTLNEPIIITDLFSHWPSVTLAKQSPLVLLRSLVTQASAELVDTLIIDKQYKGLIGYTDNKFKNYTFEKHNAPLISVLKKLIINFNNQDSDTIAVQSALINECLPDFCIKNPAPNFLANVPPRIWLGNAATVPGHYDIEHNIALNLCGKRTFYLLPANEIKNLYVAPIDRAVAGPAISLVDFENPDFEKYPKFKAAKEKVLTASLEIGEALYIPPLWWHNVKAIDPVNILVNYWWDPTSTKSDLGLEATDSLLHSILTLRNLPESQRRAWQALFSHYVFEKTDEFKNKSNEYHGILSNSHESLKSVANALKERMKQ
ncbi:MAG: cupin-like domain-containing protein [Pseudoalteromonas prydzensis]|uniref:cupin-like domain-containing protein n=1 Tax=Pseudoalteromonas prydzensis TaxID=182141 RepID=UPI003F964426